MDVLIWCPKISMVDGEYFKKLEAVARSVKGNDRPFGGIQLIFTGDFLQVATVLHFSLMSSVSMRTYQCDRLSILLLGQFFETSGETTV